jgi:hypothetical protein
VTADDASVIASAAKQSISKAIKVDCFAARAPRNDGDEPLIVATMKTSA